MKVTPAASSADTNFEFSDRKPYPGCTACAPVRATASSMASMLR